ncbi:hypothetical protein CIW49_16670 [Mycolicibacterium sp. P1-18]|uniref:hypothetical protein n=1 Tax=Mycolicibacterium sp. P1-18 TaxID=2024615 RepID=UPI0011F29B19|nr:hypothetical protein [Mycolicibacterium sp. P1-18]KAA0097508.1 hypothetical protein CIW49_16670 [Mycolicibacterium sp. P1-18]
MNVILAFLILSAPFALAALLSWASHRNDTARRALLREFGNPDYYRVMHDVDAARTRFEKQPQWPTSGATGEHR